MLHKWLNYIRKSRIYNVFLIYQRPCANIDILIIFRMSFTIYPNSTYTSTTKIANVDCFCLSTEYQLSFFANCGYHRPAYHMGCVCTCVYMHMSVTVYCMAVKCCLKGLSLVIGMKTAREVSCFLLNKDLTTKMKNSAENK